MDLFQLHGKVALVTGGNSGIGLGLARGLAEAGATAVAALAAGGYTAHAITTDVTDPAQVQAAEDDVCDRLGGLDILIANAGTNRRSCQQVAGLHERVVARTPTGRWGQPDELVGAAIFLCSRASDFVTGVALPVDGGFSSAID